MFKDQLTRCQQGELKKIGYGTILACFFFERVQILRPQVVFTEIRARYPRMLWWVEIMARTEDGRAKVKYEDPFFHWMND